MTHLALNGARRINGVSRIHGAVSSRLCADHWPEVPPEENPVGYVTNGVHVPTFLAQTWCALLRRQARAAVARAHVGCATSGARSSRCRTTEFWQTAQQVKSRMLAGVRARLQREYAAKGLSPGAAAAHHAAARPRTSATC